MRHAALWFCLILWSAVPAAGAEQCTVPDGKGNTLDAVLEAVNEARLSQGRATLQRVATIDAAAQGQACAMAAKAKLGHGGGGGPKNRLRKAGCSARTVGEAVATGQRTAAEVVRTWMASPPHKAILLLSKARVAGLGLARSPKDGRLYWVFDVANGC